MPSKKKKYNARFPAGRIKKIMQADEEVGKVAQAVPVIISRTLELFVESLLMKSVEITNKRHAKTLSPSHVKQCILAESRFDFLKDLVKNIPDISQNEEKEIAPPSVAVSPITRVAEAGNSSTAAATATANPGPSNFHHQKRPYTKRDNGQSSDSGGSDHEPIAKRSFGNGRSSQPPKTNFDDELKAFVQRRNQAQNKKAEDAEQQQQPSPSTFATPKGRLFNFYTETLPDTPEDDDKEKPKPATHSSVILPNPVYSPSKNSKSPFGFYGSQETSNSESSSDAAALPKIHIDLSKGFPLQVTAEPTTSSGYNLSHKPLKRSTSLPDPAPSKKHPLPPPPKLVKPKMQRSGRSFDSNSSSSSKTKNEPPSLLPINLAPKKTTPQLEIDEDYDT